MRSKMQFDHAAIACRDVERLRAWYERVLGFTTFVRSQPSSPVVLQPTYLVGPPNSAVLLELMPEDKSPAHPRAFLTAGLSHLALRVTDLGEWEAKLSSLGIEWLGPVSAATGGGLVRSFRDPEGNVLQIVDRQGKEPSGSAIRPAPA
jgi:glyoxylase I family protein